MTSQDSRYLSLLAERLALLTQLSRELLNARQQFIALDFDAFDRTLQVQEELCIQIRSTEASLFSLQKSISNAAVTRPSDAQDLLGRIEAARAEVRSLNVANQAMLRHSRPTAVSMRNLLNSFQPAYEMSLTASAGAFSERG